MNAETIKELEAIQSTVTTDGWNFLMEDIQKKIDAIKEEFTNPAVSVEMLRFGQGRLTVYRELLSLPKLVDNILTHAAEDAADEAADNV